MSTPDPLSSSRGPPASYSVKTVLIGGILVTIHGLSEVPAGVSSLAVLWLHHPRLSDRNAMSPLAGHILSAYRSSPAWGRLGLIVAAFDQRNHGSRLKEARANQAWREGNEQHAPDMFTTFHGTMLDTRQLIDALPAYISPHAEFRIVHHLALGVSLGGHAVWQCLLHEPRIMAGVVVIGNPDYANLMLDRARLSKRKAYAQSGKQFFGSADFPPSLIEMVLHWDPSGIFFGDPHARLPLMQAPPSPRNEEERRDLANRLVSHLGGKRIQVLTGGSDKLVPGALGSEFLQWLKRAIGPNPPTSSDAPKPPLSTAASKEWKAGAGSGWMVSESAAPASDARDVPARWKSEEWKQGAGAGWMATADSSTGAKASPGWAGTTNIRLDERVFEGVGHEFSAEMREEATKFLIHALEDMADPSAGDAQRLITKSRM